MTPCLIYAGQGLDLADISTLREALSFAEDRLKEKPQSDVHLSSYRGVYKISWHDGSGWTEKLIPESSTTRASA